ncbi:MAG: hypothetical protein HYV97_07645 [Bdellovibrio sp.]|nr:hypothetical protein [Bdellovibrio sp.]
MKLRLLTFILGFWISESWPRDELSLAEQRILDMEDDKSFGIILSIHERPEGEKIYRLGLIQGSTAIETSNLTSGEYAYFTKGIEHTLSQSTITSEEGPCGQKLRLRHTLGTTQTVKCFRNDQNVIRSTHDWVILAREFVWMKKSQPNK